MIFIKMLLILGNVLINYWKIKFIKIMKWVVYGRMVMGGRLKLYR